MPPKRSRRTDIASSSRAPPPTDPEPEETFEQPTGLHATLPIVYESIFILDDFRDSDLALFSLQYTHTAGIEALFTPHRQKAYPRLVRLFYQNLEQTNAYGAASITFSTTIDGHKIHINEAIVARALGVPMTQPADSPLAPEEVPDDVHAISETISHGALGQGSSIRRTQLVDELLFFDSLLEKNLEPAGHAERRDEHLRALYCALTSQWFSPARLALRSFLRSYNAINIDKSRTAKIFLPLLISRILDLSQYPIPPNEEVEGAPLRFDAAQFNASLSRIPRMRGRQVDPPPAAGSHISPSIQYLSDRFDDLYTRIDNRFDNFQATLNDGMEEMLTMQETSLYAQLGDQMDAALLETRRRRYARRNQ